MDRIAFKKSAVELLRKYRGIAIILLAGILLMLLPGEAEQEAAAAPAVFEEPQTLEAALSNILGNIAGAGKVEVLLTQLHGEKTIYQTDKNDSGDSLRSDTVIISNASREEAGLIQQVEPPVYLGALVVCEGAGDANVRLAIVQAVMSLTGLTSDRITVLKMK